MPHRYLGGVASVTNYQLGSIIDQMFELQYIRLIGWGKVQPSHSALVVNGSVQLKSVMPTLVVFTKIGYPLGYSVSVGPDQSADR